MSLPTNYTDLINFGENLPATISLNIPCFVSQAVTANDDTQQTSVKWVKNQNGWDLIKAFETFCDGFIGSKKTDRHIELMKCLLAEFGSMSFQRDLYSVIERKLQEAIKVCRNEEALKAAKLMGDMFAISAVDANYFYVFLKTTLSVKMPVCRKLALFKAMLQPEAMAKLKEARVDDIILFVLKCVGVDECVFTSSNHVKEADDIVKTFIKVGFFPKDARSYDKPFQLEKCVSNLCKGLSDVDSCARGLAFHVNTVDDEHFSFIGISIVNKVLFFKNNQDILVKLVQLLIEDTFKLFPRFEQLLKINLQRAIDSWLPIMSEQSYDKALRLVAFIVCLLRKGITDDGLVTRSLDILQRNDGSAESKIKNALFIYCKRKVFVQVFSRVEDFLAPEHIRKYSVMNEVFKKIIEKRRILPAQTPKPQAQDSLPKVESEAQKVEATVKKFEPENQKVELKIQEVEPKCQEVESIITEPELQEVTQAPTKLHQTSKKSRKSSKNSSAEREELEQPQTLMTINVDDADNTEKVTQLVSLLNTEDKLESFFKALLHQPSNDQQNISSTLKLLKNMKATYAESRAENKIDFANCLVSTLDSELALTKESKLNEEGKIRTARLAMIYAEAYQWKLVSNTKFTTFVQQKRLQHLPLHNLAQMSASISTRLHQEPSVKVHKAAEHLETLVKTADKSVYSDIKNGLNELYAMFEL